eukprot:scaffold19235_cov126-Isochrysis_galbana.AAC.21
MPRSSSSSCNSATTSLPMTPVAAKSLFHVMSVPASIAVCSVGKEKVKPRSPLGLPPHSERKQAVPGRKGKAHSVLGFRGERDRARGSRRD